jgi:transposase
MQVLHSRCCGLDVHKDSVVAAMLVDDRPAEVRTFGTTTAALLELGDWLASPGVTHVAMESTGVYWKPVWNLLEDRFALLLVNAQHVKAVPGRKTDVADCQWIAQLLRHGLLRASFVPDRDQRQLRELTRQRAQLVADRARVANRVQKVMEDANLKLGSVVSDVLGKSGRDMLRALIEQPGATPEGVAELARGVARRKIPQLTQALNHSLSDHHRFLLGQLLDQVEHLERQVARFERRIGEVMTDNPFERAVATLDPIPGINRRAAQAILAEIGTDMSRFPTAAHLASWAGLCPGNHESAGKRKSGRTRDGNRWLCQMLVQCAWAAARTKSSYFHQRYHRLKARRGHKRALIAIAHAMLVTIWHLLSKPQQPYADLGPDHFRHADGDRRRQGLIRKLEQMGYQVHLTSAA